MASAFRTIPRITINTLRRQCRVPEFICCLYSSDPTLHTGNTEPLLPEYRERLGEDVQMMRSRLLYQSRKRGMLENGLLLSTFAGQNLEKLSLLQLKMYDTLINKPTNDWDIYYWMTGVKEAPKEYDNEVLDMLKEHAQNSRREQRIKQPDLP